MVDNDDKEMADEEDDQDNLSCDTNVNKEVNVSNVGGDAMKKSIVHEISSKERENFPKTNETVTIPNPSPIGETLAIVNPNVAGNVNGAVLARKKIPVVSSSPKNQPLNVAKETLNNLLIPKPVLNQVVHQNVEMEEDDQ